MVLKLIRDDFLVTWLILGHVTNCCKRPIGTKFNCVARPWLWSLSSPQELGSDQLGQCSNFKAIPGSGISCSVSGVAHLLKRDTEAAKNRKNQMVSVQVAGTVVDETPDVGVPELIGGPSRTPSRKSSLLVEFWRIEPHVTSCRPFWWIPYDVMAAILVGSVWRHCVRILADPGWRHGGHFGRSRVTSWWPFWQILGYVMAAILADPGWRHGGHFSGSLWRHGGHFGRVPRDVKAAMLPCFMWRHCNHFTEL